MRLLLIHALFAVATIAMIITLVASVQTLLTPPRQDRAAINQQ